MDYKNVYGYDDLLGMYVAGLHTSPSRGLHVNNKSTTLLPLSTNWPAIDRQPDEFTVHPLGRTLLTSTRTIQSVMRYTHERLQAMPLAPPVAPLTCAQTAPNYWCRFRQ